MSQTTPDPPETPATAEPRVGPTRTWAAPSGAIVASVTRVRTAFASVQSSRSLLARAFGLLALAALVIIGGAMLLIALVAGVVVILIGAVVLFFRRLWRRLAGSSLADPTAADSPMDDLRSNVRVVARPHTESQHDRRG